MSNQQHPNCLSSDLFIKQFKNLGLDADIESCGGLVGDKDSGTTRQGQRDRRPLLLAAAQFMPAKAPASHPAPIAAKAKP
jgi:hypothetical protein